VTFSTLCRWNSSITAQTMPRGPKKHLKRLNAPRHWMLDKLSGVWAPRPSPGPHKLRECLPLILILRNRLKYALNKREVTYIVMQRLIKVDGKVRTDPNYPAGFMDVVSIEKTGEDFRLLYDTKGRFTLHRITPEEAGFKLCKVRKVQMGPRSVPFLSTHDGRTIRYPHPHIKAGDTIKLDLKTGKILAHVKFEIGNLCMVTGGKNLGRIGIVTARDKKQGAQDIVHIKDAAGNTFATLWNYIFLLGEGTNSLVSLPRRRGVRLSILEERELRMKKLAGAPQAQPQAQAQTQSTAAAKK
jgi:small subunit ribosomal protein S4e